MQWDSCTDALRKNRHTEKQKEQLPREYMNGLLQSTETESAGNYDCETWGGFNWRGGGGVRLEENWGGGEWCDVAATWM